MKKMFVTFSYYNMQSNALDSNFFVKRLDKIEYGLLVMMGQK
jgi:hypothetical protein